jgi:predicted nucleic acid-binding protein
VDAFDADVLIYAAIPDHPLGRRVAALFPDDPIGGSARPAGVGSVLLLPELLSKPLRDGDTAAVTALSGFLARLELRAADQAVAALAAVLGAQYRLRASDATHLATAIRAGAHRFITNNSEDFGPYIAEIEITLPADLPDPAGEGAGRG